MATVTGQGVADFLGRGDDTELVALAGQHVQIIAAMALAYTRGNGFTGGAPLDDVAAVLTTATARLLANPEQVNAKTGAVSVQGGFIGWSLAESFVLNRYRKRAS